jgi:CubicO group peptidase (beta-lactamase class C family)
MKNVIPSYPPSWTAGYSDVSWELLAYALENMTGRKFQDMLETDVLKPLGLNHTFLFAPNASLGAITGDLVATGWWYSLGETAA